MAIKFEYDGSKANHWKGGDNTYTGSDYEDNTLYGDVTARLSGTLQAASIVIGRQ